MAYKLHKKIIFGFTAVAIFFASCQVDDNETTNQEPAVIHAREWLEKNKLNLEVLSYTKTIDWDNAMLLNKNGEEAIEVPLILVNNISTNVIEDKDYKTHMRLLFINDKEGTYKIFTIIYTTKDPTFDYSKKSFNLLNIGSEYSGYITMQNNRNKIVFSGEYKNGELLGLHNYDQKKNLTNRFVCTYYITVGPYTTCNKWVWYPDELPGGNPPPGYMPGISGPILPPKLDPCNAAITTTKVSSNSGFLSAKAAIIKASVDGNEHSITLGMSTANVYTQSPMNNGGTNGVVVNQTLGGAFASIHNHPNNTPLSSGDIYTAVTLNTKNSNFTTSFIITGGETYSIVVTDLVAAQNFVKNYPADISPNYPPEFPDVIFDQIQDLVNIMGSSVEGRTEAIASVLDKNNAGITLMKQDSNGKFNRIKTQQTTNEDGSKTYLSVPCPSN